MDYSRIVLDNYELLGYKDENLTPKEIEELLHLWRAECQNTHTSVESAENQNKNMHLSLVK